MNDRIPPMFRIEWISVTMWRPWPKPIFVLAPADSTNVWLAQAGPAKKNVAVVLLGTDARWHYWHKASGEWQEFSHYATLDQAKEHVQQDITALV